MTQVQIQNSNGKLLGEIDADIGKPLLSQLEAAGIEIPNACKIGTCGACLCTGIEGDNGLNKSLRGEPAFPLGEGEIMTCIGGVVQSEDTIILQTMD